MKIVLSDAAADALSRVQSMKQWRVGPTMTRGSNKALDELPIPPKLEPKKRKAKAAAKPCAKEKKAKPSEAAVSLEMAPDVFARKNSTRPQACRNFMEELLRIDKAAYESIPLFDANGFCRMKFEGAEKVTLTDVVNNASAALANMCLAHAW